MKTFENWGPNWVVSFDLKIKKGSLQQNKWHQVMCVDEGKKSQKGCRPLVRVIETGGMVALHVATHRPLGVDGDVQVMQYSGPIISESQNVQIRIENKVNKAASDQQNQFVYDFTITLNGKEVKHVQYINDKNNWIAKNAVAYSSSPWDPWSAGNGVEVTNLSMSTTD